MHAAWLASLIYPLLCCLVGGFVLVKLGGLPPRVWSELPALLPHLSLYMQQGRLLLLGLLLGQALSWLLAWTVLLALLCLAVVRTRRLLLSRTLPQPAARQVAFDVQLVRQLGTARARVPVRSHQRKSEDPRIRQRRVERKKRLAGVDVQAHAPSYKRLEMVDMGDMAGIAEQYPVFNDIV